MAVEHIQCDSDTLPNEEEYSARIARLQHEYLIPLKEDLAEWLNRILGKDD